MANGSIDFRSTKFSKTQTGHDEIKSRALGLNAVARRLLVVINGKRSGADLEQFATGQDAVQLVTELMTHGLISMRTEDTPTPPPNSAASARAANSDLND